MKVGKPKEKEADQASPLAGVLADWLVTDPEAIERTVKAKAAMQQPRAPELWVKDGEARTIRFRSNNPVAAVEFYRAKLDGHWVKFVRPRSGKDLFNEAGLKSSLSVIYEVFDVDGYVSKKTGKPVKNAPRFLLASSRLNKQIMGLRDELGSLVLRNFKLRREGSSTSTQYTLIPLDPSPLTDDMRKQPRLSNELAKFYAPIPPAQQRAVLERLNRSGSGDYDE